MAALTTATSLAVAVAVAAAGAEAGKMQTLATALPICLLRSQQRALMTSAATAKSPFTNYSHPSSSSALDSPSSARRSFSSALHAQSPDSPNTSSSATAPPPPPSPPSPPTPSSDQEGEQELEQQPSPLAQEWGNKPPQRFVVRSGQLLNVLGGSVGAALRFGTGAFVQGYKVNLVPEAEVPAERYTSFGIAGRKLVETGSPGPNRPEVPIELYEFEGCPFCRKVREIVSILDLDVLYYPTPKDGPHFRPKAKEMGGKSQFPYMVDPNTGVAMYESDAIVKYLVEKYGNGHVPLALTLGPITTLTAGFAMLARAGKGAGYTPSRLPAEPLKLWAYEISPFCKVVREKLVELELPHYYYSTPRGSEKRDELLKRTGHFQVPYLEDPNTGVKMFESADIIDYLQQTYAI